MTITTVHMLALNRSTCLFSFKDMHLGTNKQNSFVKFAQHYAVALSIA